MMTMKHAAAAHRPALPQDFYGNLIVPSPDEIRGGFCQLVWLIFACITIKYMFLVIPLGAFRGEGGTFALCAARFDVAGFFFGLRFRCHHQRPTTPSFPAARRRRCRIYNIKASPLMAGRHKLWKVFQTLGALACALIVADGLLTPVVTVTSAVEGIGLSVWRFNGNSGTVSLDTGTPGDPENFGRTCTLSAAILVVVFAIQMSGSQRIGYIYSPVLVTWLVYIGVTGVIAIAEHGRGSALTLWNPIHLRRFWTQGSFRGVAAVRRGAAVAAGHAVA